ncbi:MAG: DNA-binding domain-containing protein [Bryobacteraceae bacterium]
MSLLELQRRMAADLMRPLARGDRLDPKTTANYLKPNDRLTARERLEIYSRSYWYRLLDSLYEDFPGLRAVLGARAFARLAQAYLSDRPSESWTLRNLGRHLEEWLRAHPEFAGTRLDLACDMIRLEWAHIEAFDNGVNPVLGPEDLLELGPHLRMGLQPYIRLIELRYPVDDLRVKVNAASDEHGAASNAVLKRKTGGSCALASRWAKLSQPYPKPAWRASKPGSPPGLKWAGCANYAKTDRRRQQPAIALSAARAPLLGFPDDANRLGQTP